MNDKERKAAIKIIKAVWNKAEYTLNNKGWVNYAQELLHICREETKQHDRFRGADTKRGLTITEEAKFFAVQRLCNSLYLEELNENIPELDGYHHTQKSVYQAYSLSVEFSKELKNKISLEEATQLNNLDYCKLIEVTR